MNVPTEAWLAAIIESSDDAIVGKTLDGVIRSWNPAATRTFGYSTDEAIGSSVRMLIPADRQAEEDMILQRLRSGQRIQHYETVRQRKDGSLIEVSLSVSPIRDASGQVVGAAKIARDISDTKRLLLLEQELTAQLQDQAVELEQQTAELEQQIEESQNLQTELEASNVALTEAVDAANRARAEADAANKAKSDFLAMMSHELRTPLNAIVGYVQLLEMELDAPLTRTQQGYLAKVGASSHMLLRLIEDILAFAKVESGRLRFNITDVRLADILQSLEPFVEVQLAKQGIRYEVLPCPDALIVRGDRDKIEQILVNLLSNAVKFTDAGSVIVRCSAQGSEVRVAVSDTGRGIPADQLDVIFEPFVQGERELTRTVPGTGLGLSICRQLARAMGGDVTVQSRLGSGSTFTLTLPKA